MATIPFRIANPDAPLIVVDAEVDGQGPFPFVLDTGNGVPLPVLVTPSLASQLALPAASSDLPVPLVQVAQFTLGGLRLRDIEAGVLAAMEEIGARIGVPLAGNLGSHFLQRHRLEVDYAQGTLRLDEGDPNSGFDGASFDSGPGGALILLSAHVNGRGPYRFVVDTGASMTAISPALARELRLSGARIDGMGVEGALVAETFTLDRLDVDGATAVAIEAAALDVFDYTSQAAGTPVQGILGYSFLRRFRVVIDYPARRIAFLGP